MSGRDWALSIQRHLDGIASAREVGELSEQLEADADTRRQYLQLAQIHATLAADDFDQSSVAELEDRLSGVLVRLETLSDRRQPQRLWVSVVAVAASVLMAAAFVMQPASRSEIATISSIDGSVQWTGDGGQVTVDLESGESLTGGTLELLSVDSFIDLRFLDGSAVTMSGLSMLTISDDGQKRLNLRKGRLSASVEPQRFGRPLRLTTPTAELTVLGTRFDVSAELERTAISVREGLVSARRSIDTRPVQIPAGHRAVASLDVTNQLVLQAIGQPASSWTANLEEEVEHGQWISPEHALRLRLEQSVASGALTEAEAREVYRRRVVDLGDHPGRVKAMPMPLGKNGFVVQIVVIDLTRGQAKPVILAEGSRFRIHGRVRQPTELKLGFSAVDQKSTSGARWMKSFATQHVEESFEIELPIDAFPWKTGGEQLGDDDSPAGRELANVFCMTGSREAGLEIMELSLLAP